MEVLRQSLASYLLQQQNEPNVGMEFNKISQLELRESWPTRLLLLFGYMVIKLPMLVSEVRYGFNHLISVSITLASQNIRLQHIISHQLIYIQLKQTTDISMEKGENLDGHGMKLF